MLTFSADVQDKLGIETIFKDYKDKIYRLALGISRNEKDAEDIVQNTFLKIIKNLKNFRHQSKISTWIFRIAYNEALMVLRKRRKNISLSGDEKRLKPDSESGIFVNWSKLPDEEVLEGEFRERLGLAIKKMPIKYRMPVLLHSMEGLPLKDSAQVLDLNINSLKSRLHRAYLMVKSEIVKYLKDGQKKEFKGDSSNCNILINFIYSYAAGNLEKSREAAFKKHIQDCRDCRVFLNTYTKAIRITKALECRDLPAELEAKIKSFIFKKR